MKKRRVAAIVLTLVMLLSLGALCSSCGIRAEVPVGEELTQETSAKEKHRIFDFFSSKSETAEDENKPDEKKGPDDDATTAETKQSKENVADAAEKTPGQVETEKRSETEAKAKTEEEAGGKAGEGKKQDVPSASGDGSEQTGKSCTISISCDTILNNMDQCDTAKKSIVPTNGVILSATTVSFSEGETVFDVLQRICRNKGISLEFSYTPLYGSYYIEGISNLYEFDVGPESGWMYKVNGWFPNYGCSEYTLQDGDSISWVYTCNGLGADVGGGYAAGG